MVLNWNRKLRRQEFGIPMNWLSEVKYTDTVEDLLSWRWATIRYSGASLRRWQQNEVKFLVEKCMEGSSPLKDKDVSLEAWAEQVWHY